MGRAPPFGLLNHPRLLGLQRWAEPSDLLPLGGSVPGHLDASTGPKTGPYLCPPFS